MGNIMSFVNQNDNVWDLIGKEENFSQFMEMGLDNKALLNLEKMQMKND
jgi:hypothetical protein